MIITTLLFCLALAFLFYASYSIRSNIYIRVFYRKQTTEKIVALTFDDGPDATETARVLDVLKEYRVPACFFCIGSKIAGNEAVLRRMVSEGHLIGNHSYTHSNFFPLFGLGRMKRELEKCRKELEKATGQEITFFRPPFGVTNPTVARAIRQSGFTPIGWNIRTLDTHQHSAAKVIGRIRKRLCPGSVILLHDRMPHSAELVKQVLDFLKSEGYTVVRLDSLIHK